jgi:hypothetical protein
VGGGQPSPTRFHARLSPICPRSSSLARRGCFAAARCGGAHGFRPSRPRVARGGTVCS